jgi:hypothetical protein
MRQEVVKKLLVVLQTKGDGSHRKSLGLEVTALYTPLIVTLVDLDSLGVFPPTKKCVERWLHKDDDGVQSLKRQANYVGLRSSLRRLIRAAFGEIEQQLNGNRWG